MGIRSRFRQLRLNRQAELGEPLSIADVAAEVGIDRSALSRIEHGKRLPNGDILARLCRFYKVQPGDVLQLDDDDPPAS